MFKQIQKKIRKVLSFTNSFVNMKIVSVYHTVFPVLKILNAGVFPQVFSHVNLKCNTYHYAVQFCMLHPAVTSNCGLQRPVCRLQLNRIFTFVADVKLWLSLTCGIQACFPAMCMCVFLCPCPSCTLVPH